MGDPKIFFFKNEVNKPFSSFFARIFWKGKPSRRDKMIVFPMLLAKKDKFEKAMHRRHRLNTILNRLLHIPQNPFLRKNTDFW